MKSIMTFNGETFAIEHKNAEESLWKQVAEIAYNNDFPVPSTIELVSEDGLKKAIVAISISEIRSNKEEKIIISLVEDSYYLEKSHYDQKILRRIDVERDIRNRYDMRPNNMGAITINIGAISGEIGRKGFDRLEDGIVHKPFASQLYWLRYYEKLSAGYKDYTDQLLEDESENKIARFFREPDSEDMLNDPVQELYEMLTNAAKDNLHASGIVVDFYSDKPPYTRRQVTSAKKIYLKMCAVNMASELNELMEDFIAIVAPKYQKGTTVNSFMVKIVSDPDEQLSLMAEKLEWVNSIVSSMETVVSMKQVATETYESPFGNIKIKRLSDEAMQDFIRAKQPEINRNQLGNIIAIYDVDPVKQKELYEEYLPTTFGKKESLLFHGSATCNWVSIIKNSLSLNPNAVITGKAFGNGIYFAPDSDKSAGYMSFSGSRWKSGSDKIAVMGIYRVVTGNPYYGVSTIGGAPERTKELVDMFQEKGHDCFWYKANTGSFVRDEVIIYNESACVLDKLIVMKF